MRIMLIVHSAIRMAITGTNWRKDWMKRARLTIW